MRVDRTTTELVWPPMAPVAAYTQAYQVLEVQKESQKTAKKKGHETEASTAKREAKMKLK